MQVAGYFRGAMGTGEHARQLVGALRTQGVAISTTMLHPDGAPEDEQLGRDLDAAAGDAGTAFGGFTLLCANADMVPIVSGQLGREFFAGRYTIGFWAWEVSSFPEQFAGAFQHVDEVWVGSEHVREAVSALATVPVLAIPQPTSLTAAAERADAPPGLPEGFRFLFAFDYLSVFERKNPIATVEAFTRAFPPGSGAVLIIKSLNHHHDPAAHERMRASAAAHPDIHLIEERMTHADRDGLLNAADCYVSLHRAEGFGYTLAESMWLGKPVIATGYSGNVDFMTADNSYLVDHRLVPIGPGSEPYPADGRWAEPDVDHAARLMREVFDRPEGAARRGQRAAADIRASHSPVVAGAAMVRRLRVLEHSGVPRRSRRARLREGVERIIGRTG